MKNLNEIENIIFDLGGVILNLDYDQTIQNFSKFIPQLDTQTFFGKEKQHSFFSQYEVGQISTKDFKDQFEKFYSVKFTDQQFEECWNAMILNFPKERINLLRKLKKAGKRIFLLSNINELHESEVERKFLELKLDIHFRELFDEVYYSHHINLRKPNADIFEYVINKNNLSTKNTLFIDDSSHHIKMAASLGLKTHHLVKPEILENLEIFQKLSENPN